MPTCSPSRSTAHQPDAYARGAAEELNDIRERGFAREKDEAILGESSIASPIFDHSGHAVGAIGVVGDTERIMPRGPAKQLASAVPRPPAAFPGSSVPAAGPRRARRSLLPERARAACQYGYGY